MPAYEPFDFGAGSELVELGQSQVPTGQYQYQAGTECSFKAAPGVHAIGTPAKAALGNDTYGARFTGNDPGAWVVPLAGFAAGVLQLAPGCELQMLGAIEVLSPATADAAGAAVVPMPVPNQPALEGVEFTLQAASLRAAGPLAGLWDLTDALRIRVGDVAVGCP